MRATLKRLHSPDVFDLRSYRPTSKFCILLQMMIGPEGMLGEEAFDTLVCSSDWMDESTAPAEMSSSHKMVVDHFDYDQLYMRIEEFCRSQNAESWQDLASKLSQLGKWEFADYKEELT